MLAKGALPRQQCRTAAAGTVVAGQCVACPVLSAHAALLPWPQVWRLVTTFTFIGRPSLHWLFQLVWL